jgi:hypothetical protein
MASFLTRALIIATSTGRSDEERPIAAGIISHNDMRTSLLIQCAAYAVCATDAHSLVIVYRQTYEGFQTAQVAR